LPGRTTRKLLTKARVTRSAFLEAAHEIFRKRGYYASSVSEISRHLGLSAGTFYQYFKNKEQVFLELNDLILARFAAKVEAISDRGESFPERLKIQLSLLLAHVTENFPFHRILGESELIDQATIAYYETIVRHFRDFLRREQQAGMIRPLDPNLIAYALIGICYFQALELGEFQRGDQDVLDLIVEVTLSGLNGSKAWMNRPDFQLFQLPPPAPLRPLNHETLTKGEKTRQAIFRAAEHVFGRQGFNRAGVADITREAGVAQGTFYVHFSSKKELITGFVQYINREMRQTLQRSSGLARDRRDAELYGMAAFFEFLKDHREIYRLVPEFEMISREVGLWYYRKIAEGYLTRLRSAIEAGEIRGLPPEFLARSLMGLTHFVGLRWIVWSSSPQAELPKQLFADLMEFVFFGLQTPVKE